jgi:hypothetical protein
MTSVLNLRELPQAEGGGSLRRITKDKEGHDAIVDFWNDITKFESTKLEVVLRLAKVDKTYDLTSFIRSVEYQGFDREYYIKLCLSKMSISVFCRFAVLGAIRGSNFKKISETCERMPADLVEAFKDVGFVKTPKKRDHITILRCTSSIPHWCALYLAKAHVEKKIPMECPAALQFPGAASLPMSKEIRLAHLKFCITFSSVLPGGTFKMTIYITAMSNMIPLSDIPEEVVTLLKVSSESESYKLTSEDVSTFDKQLAIRK